VSPGGHFAVVPARDAVYDLSTMRAYSTLEARSSVGRDVSSNALLRVAGAVGFALATALAAQVAIPLPGTPVPITLQTAVVLLAGLTLGPWLGAASMAFYLLLGAAGHHVFALQGDALTDWGLGYLVGSTGGYLVGFVLAQPVIGLLTRSSIARPMTLGRVGTTVIAIMAGNAVIFACGLLWLGLWLQSDLVTTLQMGLIPFLPGMMIKSVLALAAAGLILPRIRNRFDASD